MRSEDGRVGVGVESVSPPLPATVSHLLFRKYFPFGAATMNLSFPNDPSPGSSVFDFPAHREPVHTAQIPQGHIRALPSPARHSADPGSYIVISGGTGCNPICSAFGPDACYVLPISDDGGSSSEIIRVLGGPSIGVCNCPDDMVALIYVPVTQAT